MPSQPNSFDHLAQSIFFEQISLPFNIPLRLFFHLPPDLITLCSSIDPSSLSLFSMDPRYPPPPHNNSPRRELQLQGPRPTPLRVSKDSHKIRKPPPAPRDPVIIYTISPKVIHVDLADFMGLVQRLTGPGNACAPNQAFSPAAKLANIQSASTVPARPNDRPIDVDLDQLEINRPGILSPVPAALPPVSPCFFSPSYLEPGFLSFLHDLSPVGFPGGRPSPVGFPGGRPSPAGGLISGGGGGGNLFGISPGKFLSTPVIPSPGAAIWDLFKQDF